MMDQFVEDLTELWTGVGLKLNPRMQASEEMTTPGGNTLDKSGKLGFCPQGGKTCEYCQKPVLFEELESRERTKPSMKNINHKNLSLGARCQKPNCPQMITAAA